MNKDKLQKVIDYLESNKLKYILDMAYHNVHYSPADIEILQAKDYIKNYVLEYSKKLYKNNLLGNIDKEQIKISHCLRNKTDSNQPKLTAMRKEFKDEWYRKRLL